MFTGFEQPYNHSSDCPLKPPQHHEHLDDPGASRTNGNKWNIKEAILSNQGRPLFHRLEKQILRTLRHIKNIFAVLGSAFLLLGLIGCSPLPETQPVGDPPSVSSASADIPCEICDQQTIVAAMVVEQNNLEDQALATAKIIGANAQETLDSVNATLRAIQAHQENDADIIAAQIEAAAELARADAKATLVAAGSTQGAAFTQDVIEQTREQYDLIITEDLATETAKAMGTQNFLIANQIATKTQSAVQTSQSYTADANQLEEERQSAITFLWTWCFPPFVVLIAGLFLWRFWRWLNSQQTPFTYDQQGNSSPNLKKEGPKNRLRVTKPDYLQVSRWIDAVKKTLLNSGKEDEDDITNL